MLEHYVQEEAGTRIDAERERSKKAEELFKHHTEAVAMFLNELYAIMVDPVETKDATVAEIKDALLDAAKRHREQLAESAALRTCIVELEADKVRLDWLEAPATIEDTAHRLSEVQKRLWKDARSVRSAIDSEINK